MADAGKKDGVTVVEADDSLCDAATCDMPGTEGRFMSHHHLNPIGAELITGPIADAVASIQKCRASTISAPPVSLTAKPL